MRSGGGKPSRSQRIAAGQARTVAKEFYRFNDRGRAALAIIEEQFHGNLLELAEEMVEVAKDEAPYITGNLRSSIDLEEVAVRYIRVFTETGYGVFVHFGTRFMEPNPFFERAFLRARAVFERAGQWR